MWYVDDPWLIIRVDYGIAPSFSEISWVSDPADYAVVLGRPLGVTGISGSLDLSS